MQKQHGTLVRSATGPEGTFGLLVFDGTSFHTAELPWRRNKVGESCIPPGSYEVAWDTTGAIVGYAIQAVPNRGNIEIHKGNWAGDTRRGLMSDAKGCILLGLDRRVLNGQAAIGRSEAAIDQFHKMMSKEPWLLSIVESYSVEVPDGQIPVRQ